MHQGFLLIIRINNIIDITTWLSVLSKVCERIALNQLMPYLEENDRLSVHQSGNKKWHSTETSLIYTSDRILTAIDQKKTSAVVLLDMSKAFDSVNHDILVNKLQVIGLSSSTIQWFRSYLSNRYQAVHINTALSKPLLMRHGAYLAATFYSLLQWRTINPAILFHGLLCWWH